MMETTLESRPTTPPPPVDLNKGETNISIAKAGEQ